MTADEASTRPEPGHASRRPGTGTTGPTRAFVTTTACGAVRAVPHRGRRARPRAAASTDDDIGYKCTTDLHVLGLDLVGRLAARSTWPPPRRSCQRVRAADRRRVRRPVSAARSGCSAGFAWAGALLRRAAVLRARRQLAARRGRCSCSRSALPRLLAWSCYYAILVDISDRGRARPGLVARLGVRLPRRRPAAAGQPRAGPRPRRDRADRGLAVRISLLTRRHLVGGVHDHPGARLRDRPAGRRGRASAAASSRRSFGQLFAHAQGPARATR